MSVYTTERELSERPEVLSHMPLQVTVSELLVSRYPDGMRPEKWELRREGTDIIRTTDGKIIKLWSDGGQSPPHQGWGIVVTAGDNSQGYRWTLYSLPKGAKLSERLQVC